MSIGQTCLEVLRGLRKERDIRRGLGSPLWVGACVMGDENSRTEICITVVNSVFSVSASFSLRQCFEEMLCMSDMNLSCVF